MKYLKWLWQVWLSSGTRILGVAIGIDAALAGVSELIPPETLKYHLAFIAVATFLRGQMNSNVHAQPAAPESVARNHEGLDGDSPK